MLQLRRLVEPLGIRTPGLFRFGRDSRLVMVFKHWRGAAETHLMEAKLRAGIELLQAR